jgi:hypothetical protein
MVGRGTRLLFQSALALALISICVSAHVIAHAQSGPGWEVPVAVMVELQTFPPVAMLMVVVAILLYFWSLQYGSIHGGAQFGFWVVALVAFAFPIVIWLFKPEQWPFQFVTLSFFASILLAPMVILSLLLFWLIGLRWAKVG